MISKLQFYSTNKHYLRLPYTITFKSPFKSKTNQIVLIPTNNSSTRILITITLTPNPRSSQKTILTSLINLSTKSQTNTHLFQIQTQQSTNLTRKSFNPHIVEIMSLKSSQTLCLLIKSFPNISMSLEILLLSSRKTNSNKNSSNSNLSFHRLCITLNSMITEINYIG